MVLFERGSREISPIFGYLPPECCFVFLHSQEVLVRHSHMSESTRSDDPGEQEDTSRSTDPASTILTMPLQSPEALEALGRGLAPVIAPLVSSNGRQDGPGWRSRGSESVPVNQTLASSVPGYSGCTSTSMPRQAGRLLVGTDPTAQCRSILPGDTGCSSHQQGMGGLRASADPLMGHESHQGLQSDDWGYIIDPHVSQSESDSLEGIMRRTKNPSMLISWVRKRCQRNYQPF